MLTREQINNHHVKMDRVVSLQPGATNVVLFASSETNKKRTGWWQAEKQKDMTNSYGNLRRPDLTNAEVIITPPSKTDENFGRYEYARLVA